MEKTNEEAIELLKETIGHLIEIGSRTYGHTLAISLVQHAIIRAPALSYSKRLEQIEYLVGVVQGMDISNNDSIKQGALHTLNAHIKNLSMLAEMQAENPDKPIDDYIILQKASGIVLDLIPPEDWPRLHERRKELDAYEETPPPDPDA